MSVLILQVKLLCPRHPLPPQSNFIHCPGEVQLLQEARWWLFYSAEHEPLLLLPLQALSSAAPLYSSSRASSQESSSQNKAELPRLVWCSLSVGEIQNKIRVEIQRRPRATTAAKSDRNNPGQALQPALSAAQADPGRSRPLQIHCI